MRRAPFICGYKDKYFECSLEKYSGMFSYGFYDLTSHLKMARFMVSSGNFLLSVTLDCPQDASYIVLLTIAYSVISVVHRIYNRVSFIGCLSPYVACI